MIVQLYFLSFALLDRDIEPRSTILYRSYVATVRLPVRSASQVLTLRQVDHRWTAYYYVAVLGQRSRILCLPTLLYITHPVIIAVSHYTLGS